jgi:hypothetical protein
MAHKRNDPKVENAFIESDRELRDRGEVSLLTAIPSERSAILIIGAHMELEKGFV